MHIHFIAIGGSVMHQLAISLQQKGYQITGSDDAIFDPARKNLAKHGILPKKEGWYPEKINTHTKAVILGMHARKNNPELLHAKALQIPIYSFPEFIYQQAKDKLRVVIGGSHGKTSITAMLVHLLGKTNMPFDFLVGAKIKGFDYSVQLTDAPTMLIEGDEYLSSPIHPAPKLMYYQPQIALLTGIAWDHINVFPTFSDYVKQFRQFVRSLQPDSHLVYFAEDVTLQELVEKDVPKGVHCIPYQTPNFSTTTNGQLIWLFDDLNNTTQSIPLQVFGKHNLQNIAGAYKICQLLNIKEADFIKHIQSFKGAKRRLEHIYHHEQHHINIFNDFAHAPSKVAATTKAVKQRYPNDKVIACLELHTFSSLNADFLPQYKDSLQTADQAIVFYRPEVIAHKSLPQLKKEQVAEAFNQKNLLIFTQTTELLTYLKTQIQPNTCLLMMSSGNFGGLTLKELSY